MIQLVLLERTPDFRSSAWLWIHSMTDTFWTVMGHFRERVHWLLKLVTYLMFLNWPLATRQAELQATPSASVANLATLSLNQVTFQTLLAT